MVVASSEKEALLEAWLMDGVYLREAEKFRILQVDEAKNAIKELVEKEDYALAKKLAERLNSRISISDKEVLRSFRISFPAYLKIVQMAFKKTTSLGAVTKDYIAEDLTKIIDHMQKRKISDEKKKFVKKTFEKWKEQLPAKSSQKREEYILSSTLAAEDISDTVARVCHTEFWKKVRTELAEVPELLDRYLAGVGVSETEDEYTLMNVQFNTQLFEIRLKPNEGGQLQISLTFGDSFSNSDMSRAEFSALIAELRNDFGDEAMQKLWDVHEGFFCEEGPFFEIELLSGIIELRDEKLLLNNVEVASYSPHKDHVYDKFKAALLKDYDLNVTGLKKDLEELLQANQYHKIVETTEKLSNMKNRRILADFSIGVISKLLRRKTQVISLRTPEILILMWEAKRPNRFESLIRVGNQ